MMNNQNRQPSIDERAGRITISNRNSAGERSPLLLVHALLATAMNISKKAAIAQETEAWAVASIARRRKNPGFLR